MALQIILFLAACVFLGWFAGKVTKVLNVEKGAP